MHKTSSIFIRTSPHNAKRPAINTRSLIIDDSISCRHNENGKNPSGQVGWARVDIISCFIFIPPHLSLSLLLASVVYIYFSIRALYIYSQFWRSTRRLMDRYPTFSSRFFLSIRLDRTTGIIGIYIGLVIQQQQRIQVSSLSRALSIIVAGSNSCNFLGFSSPFLSLADSFHRIRLIGRRLALLANNREPVSCNQTIRHRSRQLNESSDNIQFVLLATAFLGFSTFDEGHSLIFLYTFPDDKWRNVCLEGRHCALTHRTFEKWRAQPFHLSIICFSKILAKPVLLF